MFRSGRRTSCGSVDAYERAAPGGRPPRIAVVVPRHGRTIVERNRLRRRLRELLRTRWLPAERERDDPRDLLLRARATAYERTFAELGAELGRCVETAADPC